MLCLNVCLLTYWEFFWRLWQNSVSLWQAGESTERKTRKQKQNALPHALCDHVGSYQLRPQEENSFECQAHKSPTKANIKISNGWESQHEAKWSVWSLELSFMSVTLWLYNVMQVTQMLNKSAILKFLKLLLYSFRFRWVFDTCNVFLC